MAKNVPRRDFLKSTTVVAAGAAGLCARALLAGEAATAPSAVPGLPQRVLGKTGLNVSILGFGGAAGPVETSTDKELVAKLLNTAADSGINFFDTAANYGKDGLGEKNFGLIMCTPRRKDVVLATKCEERSYDGAMKQVETSLKRMKTDYIDLMQVHHVWTSDDVKTFGAKNGVLTALYELRDQKVLRFIGMTGHPNYPQVKEALEMYDWDTFMGFVNPANASQPFFDVQLPIARKKKMGVIAMKVLGGEGAPLVGTGPGKADAARLLRFAWDSPIHTAVLGTGSLEQLGRNLPTARDYQPLTEEQRKTLMETVNQGKPWPG